MKIKYAFILKYILAGGLSYVIELATLLSLHSFAHISTELSTALVFWVGLVVSFLLQKLFTFNNYNKEIRIISKQIGKYALLILFNYTFTLLLVAAFPSHLIIISRTLALLITTLWNYIFYQSIFLKRQLHLLQTIKVMTQKIIFFVFANKQKILFVLAATIPIIIFDYQYIFTANKLLVGDFDYFAQLYEAFRISVLHFHQLPFWNPWMSGGVPLFANPQFGLFSLQSLLVLLFGAIYGLKLTYVIYAILGFWGMFFLLRKIVNTPILRSILIAYVWIFCGFWAGHNISHFTTDSLYLLPWLIYLIVKRNQKYSWLWLGLIMSIIILSAIDFVLLMIVLFLGLIFILQFTNLKFDKYQLEFQWIIHRQDIFFIIKTMLLVICLSGYRFLTAYLYDKSNSMPIALLSERPLSLSIIFKALFMPIGNLMHYPVTQWGWGEYSMYMGMGVTVAFLLCFCLLIFNWLRHNRQTNMSGFVWSILIIGVIGFLFALGDYGRFSPYHILRSLPGYSQIRVSSRWLFLTNFAILIFLASYKKYSKILDVLLVLSVIELFITFGPPTVIGNNYIKIPTARFSNAFTEYDNNHHHLDVASDAMDSYYYTTASNIGQIYTDEPFADTLNNVIGTSKCGININPACTLVMTNNAVISYWSPGKIILRRTASGNIVLNMNVASGWQINNLYPFTSIKPIDPSLQFVLSGNSPIYTMEYVPKFSPGWLWWRVKKI